MQTKLSENLTRYAIKKLLKIITKLSKKLPPKSPTDGFDRNYIDDYVKTNKNFIKGDILEFNGDCLYSKMYAPKESNIFTASSVKHKNLFKSDYYFDLNNADTLPDRQFDCIIATQVICFMVNNHKVLEHFKQMLKPGGVLILTNSGPVYQDYNKGGYMSFYTTLGLETLCSDIFGKENTFNIKSYGTLNTAMQGLLGTKKEKSFDKKKDPNISVIIGVCCKKEG